MWKHLGPALTRGYEALWRQGSRLFGLAGRMAPKSEEARRTEARARFWAAVDEGRSEAEARRR